MDAQVCRWITMLAAAGALLGGLWGYITYKEEVPDNVVHLPLSAA